MKKVFIICAAAAVLLAVSGVAQAAVKTYAIVDYPAYQIDTVTGLVDHVSGTITADPTTGVIDSASFTITAGNGGASYTVASASTGHPVSGPDYYIHVTPTEILVTPDNPSNPLGYGDLRLYGPTGVSGANSSAVLQWYTPGDPWVPGSMNWAGYTGTVGGKGSGPLFASNHDATPFTDPNGSRDTMVVATVVPEPPSVALVPNALHVAPGSTVTVSVNMTVTDPITMAAISTRILYDPNVFTYDANSGVVKGGLLTHIWDLSAGSPAEGELRVGGIDLGLYYPDYFETLAAGSGKLFTFSLKAKEDAPTGPSALTWGVYDGYDNATAGFDYGDKDGLDVILPSEAMSGASINVCPAGDLDGDCDVDFKDLAILANNWLVGTEG
jgi:hypothetical protein